MSPAPEEQNLQESFVHRVVRLPVVNCALGYAANGYEAIKNKHNLANITLTLVENSFWYTAEQAKPVLQKFEKPMHLADHMACSGLTVLENKIPLLNKQPEEILDTTKKMYQTAVQAGYTSYEGVKKMGMDKIQNLTDYSVAKVQTLVDEACVSLITSTEVAITTTEDYVNYYLPPTEDETEEESDKSSKDFVERMETISTRAQARMYRMAMKRLHYLQKRSQDALDRVRQATDLIKQSKALEAKNVVNGVVTSIQDKATWLWDELNKETTSEDKVDEIPKSLDQQLLLYARTTTKQLVQIYNTYSPSLQTLPQSLEERLAVSRKNALDIYNHFTQVGALKDLSMTILNRIQDKLAYLQSTATAFLLYLSTKVPEKNEEIEMTAFTRDS